MRSTGVYDIAGKVSEKGDAVPRNSVRTSCSERVWLPGVFLRIAVQSNGIVSITVDGSMNLSHRFRRVNGLILDSNSGSEVLHGHPVVGSDVAVRVAAHTFVLSAALPLDHPPSAEPVPQWACIRRVEVKKRKETVGGYSTRIGDARRADPA